MAVEISLPRIQVRSLPWSWRNSSELRTLDVLEDVGKLRSNRLRIAAKVTIEVVKEQRFKKNNKYSEVKWKPLINPKSVLNASEGFDAVASLVPFARSSFLWKLQAFWGSICLDHNLKMVIYSLVFSTFWTEGKNGWELASPDAPSIKIAAKSTPNLPCGSLDLACLAQT